MLSSNADWLIGGLFLAFIFGVIMYTYYEIRIKFRK
jgi:hypothetical protein